ncbi:MAG: hypothetical protein JNJ52_04425 [Flavobacterium sp.]|nr:hypothetical protein [Flavobacterium sp.]
MKNIVFSLIVLFSLTLNAQEIKLFGASSNGKIQLKWMSKKLNAQASYDVLRSEGNSNWQKVNSSPIVESVVITEGELKSSKNPFPKDKSYELYIKHKSNKEKTPNKQAFADYQLILGAIFDNQLAKHLGIYFEDATVVSGKTYHYKLVDAKTQKELSVVNAIKVDEAAAAPERLASNQEKQDVKLTWKNNEDFFGYNAYRNGTKINDEPILANLEGNNYTVFYVDSNIFAGSYSYTIKGITFFGSESKPSDEVKISVKDATPPSVVKGIKIERKERDVQLTWLATNDKESVGYNIHRSEDNGKTFKKINTQSLGVKEAKFVDHLDVKEAGTFLYYIENVDTSNNGKMSNPVSVLVPDHFAPTKPADFSSKVQPGKVTLAWKANTEKDLAGYRIYRGLKDDDENEMLLLNVTPQKETTYVDTFNEKAGTKFIYKILAIDQSFNESEKAILWVQLPDVIPPQAPVLKEANYESGRVLLKWDEVLTDKIAGYNVFRMQNNREEKVNAELIKTNSFSETLTQKGIVEYYVKAIDSAQLVSKPSNKMAITTASSVATQLQLLVTQETRSKKVNLKVEGIKPEEVQEVKLFKRTGKSGFVGVPFKIMADGFIDEASKEGEIYEYYLEVLTVDDVRLKSEKVIFNNHQ